MPLTPRIPSVPETAALRAELRNLNKIDFAAEVPEATPARKPEGDGRLPAEQEKMPLDAMPGAPGSTIRR